MKAGRKRFKGKVIVVNISSNMLLVLRQVSSAQDMLSVTEEGNPSSEEFALNQNYACPNLHNIGTSGAPLNQTRRRLFHVPPITMQQATTFEQTRLEEEVVNEMILEEQKAEAEVGGGTLNPSFEEEVAHEMILEDHALREAEVIGALNPSEVVELLLEELLLSVVGKKTADGDNNASSEDFFSQDSQPQQQHLAPCSQDFAFFKAIEQTREDLTTEEEDESQENGLSPPSQLACSPSTSELGDLLG